MDYGGLVVADDVTGATDTGHRLAARGYDVVVGRQSACPDADVLVRTTDSRHLTPERAAARVTDALTGVQSDVVYKKIDSTLRGNVVAEVDAAMAATEGDLGVVAPAFPAQGRTTDEGTQFVAGQPVDRSEPGVDGQLPTASVRELLAATSCRVTALPLDVVEAGPQAIAERLTDACRNDTQTLVVCDATHEHHLSAIARGGHAFDGEVLYVGSGGLAGHVRLEQGHPVVGIAGSTARETLAGLDVLPDGWIVEVDAPLALEDMDRAVAEAARAATEAARRHDQVVITAARSTHQREETLAAAAEVGLSEDAAMTSVAQTLGAVAREVLTDLRVGGVFLTGGATAEAVLAALDAGQLRLTGRSVEAGVPVGRIEGDHADGVPVVTKAGAFGDDETILRCLDALAAHDD